MRISIDSLGTVDIPRSARSAWFVGIRCFDAHGRELSINEVLAQMNHQGQIGMNLAAPGLIGWAYYQPDVRFWPFQAIEAAIFLGLAALWSASPTTG